MDGVGGIVHGLVGGVHCVWMMEVIVIFGDMIHCDLVHVGVASVDVLVV